MTINQKQDLCKSLICPQAMYGKVGRCSTIDERCDQLQYSISGGRECQWVQRGLKPRAVLARAPPIQSKHIPHDLL